MNKVETRREKRKGFSKACGRLGIQFDISMVRATHTLIICLFDPIIFHAQLLVTCAEAGETRASKIDYYEPCIPLLLLVIQLTLGSQSICFDTRTGNIYS
jgi:hypothetical protein